MVDHIDQTSGDRVTGADVVDGVLTLKRDDGSEVSAPSLRFVSLTVDHDTSGLNNGIEIFTPAVGDTILDIYWDVLEDWNGTTPKIDFGSFIDESAPNLGLSDFWGAGPATLGAASYSGGGFRFPSNALAHRETIQASSIPIFPLIIEEAIPFKVVVSQNGHKGGTAVGGTTGSVLVRVLVL